MGIHISPVFVVINKRILARFTLRGNLGIQVRKYLLSPLGWLAYLDRNKKDINQVITPPIGCLTLCLAASKNS